MSEELEVDDQDELDDAQESSEYSDLQHQLLGKCKSAGIEAEIKEFLEGDTYISVGFPNGREKRWTLFSNSESIKQILSFDFNEFVFLGEYVAVANYSQNTIEAVVRGVDGVPSRADASVFIL